MYRRWNLNKNDFSAARAARQEFAEYIREQATQTSDVSGAEIIFGELVGNALRHGREPISVTLERQDSRVMLEVSDCGGGFALDLLFAANRATDAFNESGRGLQIVVDLARTLQVQRARKHRCRVIAELPVDFAL
jgi:two-component system, OmpR family, sensor histidine kinase MtrB